MSLREWFFRRAMARVTAKPSPSRIPLSGERLMQRDYLSATLSGLAEGDVLVDALAGDVIQGRAWVEPTDSAERGEYAAPVEIPVARAALAKAHYTYYLRQYEYSESNSATLWLRLVGGYYHLDARREDFRQGRFNRQSLERRNRMDLLQWLIENAPYATHGLEYRYSSPVEILARQHGQRWIRHPAARETLNYTRMLLESLRYDGLVEFDNVGGFRPAPRAVAEIESFHTDERRHKDSQSVQQRLLWVAALTGAAAIIQAVAAAWPIVEKWRSASDAAAVAGSGTQGVPSQGADRDRR
ncbi:hypothetical protein [Burkholderia multivorans]|jgi:hypothetical protein|uniref:hypothetical protein n=1 Tax=Burkholderia multivorans TaxID=87883 RepID=UPI0021C18F11|nr:hypothetical protein [Burkholderia multivorans]MDR9051048.1 hypothetical protein [Burkholderia multivorans]MDR9060648.1 hypothetical protein [Burkholderia multivorans]MDR9062686.1 hypothetical protein [Burkholderia multivorans]MDR9078043.1 hypothetical protein [Burkholderia multivorans]MDR9093554.1 hypothetical protein [Burkholderia multivorans]